jgi:hypothetical protein
MLACCFRYTRIFFNIDKKVKFLQTTKSFNALTATIRAISMVAEAVGGAWQIMQK